MHHDAQFIRLKKGIVAFLCFYAVAGFSTFFLLGEADKNVPPVFHWFLFSWTPNEGGQVQYAVRFTAVEGATLAEPLLYAEAADIAVDRRSGRARDLVNRLARALESGDGAEAERIRTAFEDAFVRGEAEYEVIRITYDPIERFATGAVENIEVLATFTSS